MRRERRPALTILTVVLLGACGMRPGMLAPGGEPARQVAPLGWWLTGTAVTVSLAVFAVLWIGLRRALRRDDTPRSAPRRERRWFLVGVTLTVAVLGASYAGTIVVLRAVVAPDREAGLAVTITGHQWWWEATYHDPDFTTANEIHIPVGTTVRVTLRSADVIHSFWVPALGGKTDLVPGAPATIWLRADRAGRYQGRCAEYCGLQHAHMAFAIVAEPADSFAAWARHQADDAQASTGATVDSGRALVVTHCGGCHTIRGTAAAGTVGPDLTHLMSRATIAGGAATTNAGDLGGWIADPDGIKPGTLMPRVSLASTDLIRVLAYLRTLR